MQNWIAITTLAVQDEGAAAPAGASDLGPTVPTGEQVPGTAADPTVAPPQQGFDPFMLLLPLVLVFFVFMIWSSGRKAKQEQKAKEQMRSAIRTGDKVQTIGGVIGTVIETNSDDVLVETDKASHTRIRFQRAALQQVLSSKHAKDEAPAAADQTSA